MKIGILTFHSQVNYGGVLQAYALQEVLKQLGHDVVVIDRWVDRRNKALLGPYPFFNTFKKISYWFNSILCEGIRERKERHQQTIRFLQEKLRLTPYSFYQWKTLQEKALGLDLIIVGSDQVWNATFNNPLPYLLEDAPPIPAISYAASFGMREIPEKLIEKFKEGFSRFQYISCREEEGVGLVSSLGYSATHVVDPTILLAPKEWTKRVESTVYQRKTLVCYLLGEDVYKLLPKLKAFSEKMACDVEIFVNKFSVPVPTTPKKIRQWRIYHSVTKSKNVRIAFAAGPQQFIDAFASATWVLTDSFHAIMFSSIFNRNVRAIRPLSQLRREMFARIEEFAEKNAYGPLIMNSSEEALSSFSEGITVSFKQDSIDQSRQESLDWLQFALNNLSQQKE